MLSITLKRSAATLGVLAGLLAAAAPASAVGENGSQGAVKASAPNMTFGGGLSYEN